MNELAYVLQAWLPLIVWQQVEAPEYRKGYITITALSAALIVTAFTIRVLHARELAKKGVEDGLTGQDSSAEEDVAIMGKDDVGVGQAIKL